MRRSDDELRDGLVRLIFTACHPLVSREARVALALRMLCGLTTDEIARAFLVPEPTVAQRIVRAKRTLSESGLGYEPLRQCLAARRLVGEPDPDSVRLARTMRWEMVASGTRKARAISDVVKPQIMRSASAARASRDRSG